MSEGVTGRSYDLEDRFIDFSVRVLNLVEVLPGDRIGNHVAGQIMRSGTSPAANYAEACAAESQKDFVHKLKISLKEMRETNAWMKVIHRKPLVENVDRLKPLLNECDELIRILASSIRTSEDNRESRNKK